MVHRPRSRPLRAPSFVAVLGPSCGAVLGPGVMSRALRRCAPADALSWAWEGTRRPETRRADRRQLGHALSKDGAAYSPSLDPSSSNALPRVPLEGRTDQPPLRDPARDQLGGGDVE